jgi:Flp pilus assembly protein TadG
MELSTGSMKVCRRSDDRGQTTPLVALMFVVVAGALVALGHLGGVVADRGRARTAADAAALAATADGETGARQVAAANRGDVSAYTERGGDVEVTVRVGQAEATARARADWSTGAAIAPR